MIYIKKIFSIASISLTLFSSIALASDIVPPECPPSVPECGHIWVEGEN